MNPTNLMEFKKEVEWWYPHDFMKNLPPELFVGYEASARLSELAREYPSMILSEKRGRFIVRRLDWENTDQFYNRLPKELSDIFDAEHYKQTRLI